MGHYPPQYRQDDWARLASENAIDLIVTGHRHEQVVSNRDPAIGGAAWVVSGGGGGITSEHLPRVDGNDDQYGFFDVTISRSAIKLEGISHGGVLRSTTVVAPRVRPTSTTSTTTSTNTSTTETTVTETTTSLTTTHTATATHTVTSRFRPSGRHRDNTDGLSSMSAATCGSHCSWILLLVLLVALCCCPCVSSGWQ